MKQIKLDEMFDVEYGNKFDLNKLDKYDANLEKIAFVSRSSKNNGVACYVNKHKNITPYDSGLITVTLGGTYLLSTFVQQQSFYTAQNIKVLIPKISLTLYEKLFYCTVIKHNRFRYTSHGREANKTLNSIIIPGIDEARKIINSIILSANFKTIINASTQIEQEQIKKKNKYKYKLEIIKWGSFKLEELFDIQKGKRLTRFDMVAGKLPYLGASALNNGVTHFIDADALFDGNVISVNYDGSIGEAFYQDTPFWASDAVNILIPKFKMSPSIALFICTVIRVEKYRYNYGRKWGLEKMKQSTIKLPTINALPNWELIEEYMNQLPYADKI